MHRMSKFKTIALGGVLAGSLVAAVPVSAQSRQELRHDQMVLDRDYEQLRTEREVLNRHLRMGASRRQIARDEENVRIAEARVRQDEAELRRDRRDFAGNYGWWRYDNEHRYE